MARPPGTRRGPKPKRISPWHDSSIVLDERLRLADGRLLQRRLMAAIAQLNCGSARLRTAAAMPRRSSPVKRRASSSASPGNKETAKALEELVALDLGGAADAAPKTAAKPAAPAPAEKTWSRTNPFPARILEIRNLNGEGSAKHVPRRDRPLGEGSHLPKSATPSGSTPTNCDALVEELIARVGAAPDERR